MGKGTGSSLRSREKVEQVQAEPRQGNVLVNTPNARRLRISAKEALAGCVCWSGAQGSLMTPNNGSGAIYHDHSNTLVGVRHARITEQRGWAAAHAGIWLACSDARRTPSRRSHAHRPLRAAHAAAQSPLPAARTSPKTNPSPRYTHQSTRITKPSSALFRNDRERQNRILRKLGTPDRRRGLEAGLCGCARVVHMRVGVFCN